MSRACFIRDFLLAIIECIWVWLTQLVHFAWNKKILFMFFGLVLKLMKLGIGFSLFSILTLLLLLFGLMLSLKIFFYFQNLLMKFGIFFRLVFCSIYGKLEIILSLGGKRLQPLSLSLISNLIFYTLSCKVWFKWKEWMWKCNTYKICLIIGGMPLVLSVMFYRRLLKVEEFVVVTTPITIILAINMQFQLIRYEKCSSRIWEVCPQWILFVSWLNIVKCLLTDWLYFKMYAGGNNFSWQLCFFFMHQNLL